MPMGALSSKIAITPAYLFLMPDEKKYELTNGELVERQPIGAEASWVQRKLCHLLFEFCEERNAGGFVFVETGFTCFPEDPNRVLKPDVSFVRSGRSKVIPKGYISIAPDLALKVVSPTDLYYDVECRIQEYLQAGVQRVWVVSPNLRFLRIHRPDWTISQLREGNELTGEDILPGFRCSVGSLFHARNA